MKTQQPWVRGILTIVLLTLTSRYADALINPNFTPNMLVDQSDRIQVVKLVPADDGSHFKIEVLQTLKGTKAADGVLDLGTAVHKEWAKFIHQQAVRRKGAPVPLFVGKHREQSADSGMDFGVGADRGNPGEDARDAGPEEALLNIDRAWVRLFKGKTGHWEMASVDEKLQGTWDGGSDMLIAATRWLLKHPDEAYIPVTVGYDWEERLSVAILSGRATTLQAVDLTGTGDCLLFVGAESGDRFYAWNDDSFVDVTDKRGLATKSRMAAWGDFDGDGRLDLASVGKMGLHVSLQSKPGTLQPASDKAPVVFEAPCLGLVPIGGTRDGRADLLASVGATPVVVTLQQDGTCKASPVASVGSDKTSLGQPSACLVADLNNDGLPDILQPLEQAALVYKGKSPGEFFPPVRTPTGTGGGRVASCVGDFDMDGRLDIVMAGAASFRFWNSRGDFRFVDTFAHTGEMSYTAQAGGVVPQACDINNDGVQDLFVAYAEDIAHLYFNRGFRSFGKALSLVWQDHDASQLMGSGQQVGLVADLNADGAQDMALITTDGDLVVLLRETFGEADTLSVQARLPLGKGFAGPVTVTASSDWLDMGARNVTAGSSQAFFGQTEPGAEITLKWKSADGKTHEKIVLLEDRCLRIRLGD